MCGGAFEGLAAKILCSPTCRERYRPKTFKDCEHCGKRFGPVNHLSRRFCAYRCKADASRTGKLAIWKVTPMARAAHLQVRYAIRRGDMVRPPSCEECGKDGTVEGAHHDYKRPLDVRWLCRGCHARWDRQEPKGGAFKYA